MKLVVLKSFIDKETQIGYNAGNTYESSDSERVAFLQREGFLHSEPKKGNKKKQKDGE